MALSGGRLTATLRRMRPRTAEVKVTIWIFPGLAAFFLAIGRLSKAELRHFSHCAGAEVRVEGPWDTPPQRGAYYLEG